MTLKKSPVAFMQIIEYESTFMDSAIAAIIEECDLSIPYGSKILVKPNFVSPKNPLACTHPNVILSLCRVLKDYGANVIVGDSPAFGTAKLVAKNIDLYDSLQSLNIPLITLGKPKKLELSFGSSIGISREALENDMIFNLPKLKAHCQFFITGAVKNMFGTVVGFRKAYAHTRLGETPSLMEKLVIEVNQAMPHSFSLIDAIYPMHKHGPINGEPFKLSLLAGSTNQYALDTALYMLLGLNPRKILLWNECINQKIHGYDPSHINHVMESPSIFNTTGFKIPDTLSPMEFEPVRFVKGRIKSLLSVLK